MTVRTHRPINQRCHCHPATWSSSAQGAITRRSHSPYGAYTATQCTTIFNAYFVGQAVPSQRSFVRRISSGTQLKLRVDQVLPRRQRARCDVRFTAFGQGCPRTWRRMDASNTEWPGSALKIQDGRIFVIGTAWIQGSRYLRTAIGSTAASPNLWLVSTFRWRGLIRGGAARRA
jgi:hypothetical protein